MNFKEKDKKSFGLQDINRHDLQVKTNEIIIILFNVLGKNKLGSLI